MNTGEMVCERVEASSAQPIHFAAPSAQPSRFVPVLTLVLWVGLMTVAAMGMAMPYARALVAKTTPPPMQVEMLNVELSNDPIPDSEPPLATSLPTPPPMETLPQPQIPQTVAAVAMPSPAIAFALPVEGPVRVVEAKQATYVRPAVTETPAPVMPPVQTLTFGKGDGKQPAPEYPARAQDQGQQGTVRVRFIVSENGRVAMAEAVAPSPWPLLNDSAVRTIRNRWRFASGSLRVFEVPIHFQL